LDELDGLDGRKECSLNKRQHKPCSRLNTKQQYPVNAGPEANHRISFGDRNRLRK